MIPAAELPARVAEILGSRPADKRVLFLAADEQSELRGGPAHRRSREVGRRDVKIEFVDDRLR